METKFQQVLIIGSSKRSKFTL